MIHFGRKILLVMEAGHIIPFVESGPHHLPNGILLRADIVSGYLTITKDYKVEVSKKLREVFENGKEY